MTAAERISNALRAGESNAVSLADMCIISGLDNRHTRLVIEDMRRKGAVICSSECAIFILLTAQSLADTSKGSVQEQALFLRRYALRKDFLRSGKDKNNE